MHVFPYLIGILLSAFWSVVLGTIEVFDSDMEIAAGYFAFAGLICNIVLGYFLNQILVQFCRSTCGFALFRSIETFSRSNQIPTSQLVQLFKSSALPDNGSTGLEQIICKDKCDYVADILLEK